MTGELREKYSHAVEADEHGADWEAELTGAAEFSLPQRTQTKTFMKSKAQPDDAASYTTLRYEKDGAIATITLNRPDKRNAISSTMIEELLAALNAAEADPRCAW